MNLRAIDRVIQSNDFVVAWSHATQNQREELLRVLGNKDLNGVRLWVHKVGYQSLLDLPYRELRDLAQRHSVPRYSRLDKDQLVIELKKRGINDNARGQ